MLHLKQLGENYTQVVCRKFNMCMHFITKHCSSHKTTLDGVPYFPKCVCLLRNYQGTFSFQKTRHQYSRMALGQIHTQNKVIKGVSCATNLLNPAEFEDKVDRNNTNYNVRYHEDNLQFHKMFEDVNKTISGMNYNPFAMEILTLE